jgi:hypothetical protein
MQESWPASLLGQKKTIVSRKVLRFILAMKIRQHGKMGVSCLFDAFERNATGAITPPYCFNCVKWFVFMYSFLCYASRLLRYQQRQTAIVVVVVAPGQGRGDGSK